MQGSHSLECGCTSTKWNYVPRWLYAKKTIFSFTSMPQQAVEYVFPKTTWSSPISAQTCCPHVWCSNNSHLAAVHHLESAVCGHQEVRGLQIAMEYSRLHTSSVFCFKTNNTNIWELQGQHTGIKHEIEILALFTAALNGYIQRENIVNFPCVFHIPWRGTHYPFLYSKFETSRWIFPEIEVWFCSTWSRKCWKNSNAS